MKTQTLHMSLTLIIFVGTSGLAKADLRSDNFNDNSQAATWKKLEQDPPNCWVDETNSRLEVRATGLASDMDALYVSHWDIIPTDDFQVKVSFYNSVVSWTWNEVYIGIGFRKLLENFEQDYIYIAAACDEDFPVFWYERVENGSSVTGNWKSRFSNSGTLYISYNATQDELYLSDTGYGSGNSWKTFSGVLQGAWDARLLGVGVGGSSENVLMGPGLAYLDNFVVDSGTLCTSIPPLDLDQNCKVDFKDFALFALSWLDCNMDPPEACG
jgi:hypothetical protein